MQNAWEQHSKEAPSSLPDRPRGSKAYRQEFMAMLQPPDDFRQLNIVPDCDDMQSDVQPFLRPNLIKGSYPDVDTYLDVQFRLLREDFFMPLRQGLTQYRSKIEGGKKQRNVRIDNVRLYNDAQILEMDPKAEDTYTIQFSSKGMERINWEGSKRLMFGSLLLLSADDFNTFFLFTVAERNPTQLRVGKLKAKFEGTSLPAQAGKQKLMMAESSVFFEAYRSILYTLQRISPAHFPLKRYILGQNIEPKGPSYLANLDDVTSCLFH